MLPAMANPIQPLKFAVAPILAMSLFVGCSSSPHYFQSHTPRPLLASPVLPSPGEIPAPADIRRLPMFAGHDGQALTWRHVLDAAQWADVIIVGEQHDDAVGHAFQNAIVSDSLARFPQTAFSLEMLERHEQSIVDDYLAGLIDAETFIKETNSSGWAGKGSWEAWYQPMIDAARQHDARVIAANAPRRYVRLARLEGYARLDSLSPAQRALFDRPRKLPQSGPYRERFFSLMSRSSHSNNPQDTSPAPAPAHPLSNDRAESVFRSQMVWDATMAESIARALRTGSRKVVHIVGQFHSDFEGGTVAELRQRKPGVRILTISMQREDALTLRPADVNRADIIVYTGKRPPDPEKAVEESPE